MSATDAFDAPGRRGALDALETRRSVSPRRLESPGPTEADLARALRVAGRAPDHGALRPWRVIDFPATSRARFAELFADEKLRRAPEADADDLARARAHALEPPTLLGFVVRIDTGSAIPAHEQWLAAGAALGNLLNAFHLLGHGAIVLSGERCADRTLAEALGVAGHERLVGFVSVGRIGTPPKPTTARAAADLLTRWTG